NFAHLSRARFLQPLRCCYSALSTPFRTFLSLHTSQVDDHDRTASASAPLVSRPDSNPLSAVRLCLRLPSPESVHPDCRSKMTQKTHRCSRALPSLPGLLSQQNNRWQPHELAAPVPRDSPRGPSSSQTE